MAVDPRACATSTHASHRLAARAGAHPVGRSTDRDCIRRR